MAEEGPFKVIHTVLGRYSTHLLFCLFVCLFVCLLFVLSKLPLSAKKNNTFLFLKFKFKSRDRAELGSYGSGKSLGFLPLLNLRSGKSLVTCPFLSVSRQG